MITSRIDAYISRYGDFCANDDNNNDNDDTTDYFTSLEHTPHTWVHLYSVSSYAVILIAAAARVRL